MKVTAVEAWVESFELTRPYTIAFKTFDTVHNVIVKIQGERGRVGLGAAAAFAGASWMVVNGSTAETGPSCGRTTPTYASTTASVDTRRDTMHEHHTGNSSRPQV